MFYHLRTHSHYSLLRALPKVDEIVKRNAVKDWHLGTDVEKKMISSIEVEVFYYLEDTYKVTFTDEEMQEMIENIMLIAKRLDYR